MRYKLPEQFPLIQIINKFCLRKSSLSIWRRNWQMEKLKVKNICLPTLRESHACQLKTSIQGQFLTPDSKMQTDCSLTHD